MVGMVYGHQDQTIISVMVIAEVEVVFVRDRHLQRDHRLHLFQHHHIIHHLEAPRVVHSHRMCTRTFNTPMCARTPSTNTDGLLYVVPISCNMRPLQCHHHHQPI
jgi:hypothetical protein